MNVIGDRIRVASKAPAYSAFDGWIGTVTEVHATSLSIQLDRYPIPLVFGTGEVRPVAVPTARVGVHFPGQMCDMPRIAGEQPHLRNTRAGCPACYVPGAEKGD